MWIKNGLLLNDQFVFEKTDIAYDGDTIIQISDCANEDGLDATDCYVVPGFIDTHMHGGFGHAFLDCGEDEANIICQNEAKNGTTSLVPALSAAPTEKMVRGIRTLQKLIQSPLPGHAMIRGIHLEGPFFAEKYKGAHLPENIRNATVEEYRTLKEAAKEDLKIITMAPELPGSDAVIPMAVADGVCVSAGHTNATAEDMKRGFALGVSQGTHLFNAMSPIGHREPGAAGSLLIEEKAKCELICDFLHIHPDIIKMVYQLKGRDKINLITDSEIATGMPDGEYEVNGRTLIVKDKATRTTDGTIAGGSSCLIDCVRNVASLGIPLGEACQMATKNPAQTVGIYDSCGSLSIGKQADILILDKSLELKHVILRGELLF